MKHTKLVIAMAALSVSTVAQAAITWNSDVSNASWGTASSWTSTPLFDGTEDAILDNTIRASTGDRETRLNGDRYINSLTLNATKINARFTIQPGSGGKLRLASGNLAVTSNGYSSFYGTIGATISVEGGTEASPAVWALNNTGNQTFSAIEGSASRWINLTGAPQGTTTWSGNSSAFYGTIKNALAVPTSSQNNTRMQINASNALGGVGSKLIVATTYNGAESGNLYFNSGATTAAPQNSTHDMNIQFDVTTGLAIGTFSSAASPQYSNITFNGDLSGVGGLEVGVLPSASSVFRFGRFIVNGDNNTASGNVRIRGGRLQVDGTWTNAGNFTVNRGVLAGIGSVTLGSGKTVSVQAQGSADANDPFATIAAVVPGEVGVVGTLTFGGDSTNSLSFSAPSGNGTATQFVVDVSGATADRLNVTGDLNIAATGTQLVLNELLAPTEASYVLMSWTGTRSGTFASVTGMPDDYELQYTSNQLLLVNPSIPEPTSIAGLALLGGLLARRRR